MTTRRSLAKVASLVESNKEFELFDVHGGENYSVGAFSFKREGPKVHFSAWVVGEMLVSTLACNDESTCGNALLGRKKVVALAFQPQNPVGAALAAKAAGAAHTNGASPSISVFDTIYCAPCHR
jgi:hypothetical protein